jgi:hypothetical protein
VRLRGDRLRCRWVPVVAQTLLDCADVLLALLTTDDIAHGGQNHRAAIVEPEVVAAPDGCSYAVSASRLVTNDRRMFTTLARRPTAAIPGHASSDIVKRNQLRYRSL